KQAPQICPLCNSFFLFTLAGRSYQKTQQIMNIQKSFFILGLLPLAFACTENKTEFAEIDQDARNLIQEDSFIRYVQDLSADEFLGRAPFTKGDTLTVNYIEEQFKNIGLEPGNGDSFFQEVPMAEIASLPANPKWTFEGKN